MLEIGTRILAGTAPELTALRKFHERTHHQEDNDPELFVQQVCDRFLALSDDQCAQLLTPSTPSSGRLLSTARRFVTEFNLHAWVARTNSVQGVAPAPGEVLRRRLELTASAHSHPGQMEAAASTKSAKYRWLRHWKRRWGMKACKLQPGEVVPVETMQKKAGRCKLGMWSRSTQQKQEGGPVSP